MPDLRTDRLTGRSVFVAENRASRPNEFGESLSAAPTFSRGLNLVEPPAEATWLPAGLSSVSACPFCAGQEHLTPPAVYEVRGTDGNWKIRVVPNKFPAVTLEPDNSTATDRAYWSAPALGAHEVLIESSRHVDRISMLSPTELREVLTAYAARLRHWRADGRFSYGLIFKNQGPSAGASLAHVHSQCIALPDIPPAVDAELCRAESEYREHGSCPYCRLIQNERSQGERVIFDDDGFLAWCPFASLQPYETWVSPTDHQYSFEDSTSDGLDRLADVLHKIAMRTESVLADPACNVLLRTSPWRVQCGGWNHWRIELLPRLTAIAGFELASGMFINPVAPERAAGKLRSI